MLWLRNLSSSPPGEFYYRQAESGSKVFGPSPLINTVASEVGAFRKGNNLPGADYRTCLRDIVQFTVARLPTPNEWVIEVADQDPLGLVPSISGGGCSGCGVLLPKE